MVRNIDLINSLRTGMFSNVTFFYDPYEYKTDFYQYNLKEEIIDKKCTIRVESFERKMIRRPSRFRGSVEYSAEGYIDRLLGCVFTRACVRSPGDSTMSHGEIVAINCNFVLSTRFKPSFLYARSELRCAQLKNVLVSPSSVGVCQACVWRAPVHLEISLTVKR